MADHRGNHEEPEVFDRLQRLALHERRRRWDSTRLALAANPGDSDRGGEAPIPADLLTERFDSLECQLAALARELRRVERRAGSIAMRARVAVALGLIAAIASMGLWTGALHDWYFRMAG